MTTCTFKDLCIDANRPELVGPFWGGLLGLRAEQQEGSSDWALTGTHQTETIWVNPVPEPQTAKSRVHVDVRFLDGLPAAPVVQQHPHWSVMSDPDGLVFCAMGPREDAPAGAFELVVDAVDPERIAAWWAERFGVEVRRRVGSPYPWLEGVPGFPWPYWVFAPVPERKTAKNRVHWDVRGDVEELVAAGATVLDVREHWTVLADPEGNEFCCFALAPQPGGDDA